MRLLPVVFLIGCTSAPAPSPVLSDLAQELSSMPDSSAAMTQASEAVRGTSFGHHSSEFWITSAPPMVVGFVVEVWRDRLAVLVDNDSVLPSAGSFMAVYDRAGVKADAYVVRVRGRFAFTQFRLLGSCTTPEVGDRAVCQDR